MSSAGAVSAPCRPAHPRSCSILDSDILGVLCGEVEGVCHPPSGKRACRWEAVEEAGGLIAAVVAAAVGDGGCSERTTLTTVSSVSTTSPSSSNSSSSNSSSSSSSSRSRTSSATRTASTESERAFVLCSAAAVGGGRGGGDGGDDEDGDDAYYLDLRHRFDAGGEEAYRFVGVDARHYPDAHDEADGIDAVDERGLLASTVGIAGRGDGDGDDDDARAVADAAAAAEAVAWQAAFAAARQKKAVRKRVATAAAAAPPAVPVPAVVLRDAGELPEPVVVPLGHDSAGDIMALRRVLGPWKMVIAMRSDLGMGKGKLCAQAAHAALAAYAAAVGGGEATRSLLKRWEATGQTKVVVRVGSEEELLELARRAEAAGIGAAIIRDAGHTQVAAGSATAVALGPDVASALDSVAGHLKLL